MNKKRLFIILAICGILAAAFILGMAGVIDLNKKAETKQADRLIGMLITNKFPTADVSYKPGQGVVLLDRVQGVPAEKDDKSTENRIPAEYDYIFPNNDGVRLFNVDEYFDFSGTTHRQVNMRAADEVFSNLSPGYYFHDNEHNGTIRTTEKTYSITGTLYYVLQAEEETFFASSIYQTAEGEIYMVPSRSGQVISSDYIGWGPTEFTSSCTYPVTDEDGETITEGRTIKAQLKIVHEPVKITLCQFNASHELLQADEYKPDEIPRTIITLPEATLLLVDTENKPVDGHESHTYESYNNETEQITTLQYVDNGFCKANIHKLRWIDPEVATDLAWKLENGTLTISGNGKMENYTTFTDELSPWWKKDCTRLIVEEGITSLGNHAFDSKYNLKDVSLPQSLIEIGECAFDSCSALTEIIIPDSVTRIDGSAFRDCTQLKKITLPDSITSIGNFAFEGCSSLEYINLPASIQNIGVDVFQDCENLKSVTVAEGSYAEQYCISWNKPCTY